MVEKRKEYDPKSDPEIIEFKRVIKAVLLTAIIMILISTIWTVIISFGYGNLETSQISNIDYTFQNDNLYNSASPVFDSDFNVRDADYYEMGFYNATYSFTNEVDDTNGIDIDFIDVEAGTDSNIESTIIASNTGHQKIIRFTSEGDNGAFANWRYNTATEPELGTIEIWFRYVDKGQGQYYIQFVSTDPSTIIVSYIDSTTNLIYAEYGNGGGGITTVNTALSGGLWHQLSYEFDSNTDKYSMWVNGVILVDDQNYINDITVIAMSYWHLQIQTGGGVNNLECYFDAVGYSWDTHYFIGNNFVPFVNTSSNAIEVDRWEFAFSDFETLNAIGLDNPNGWTDVESGGDQVNIAMDPHNGQRNRVVLINQDFHVVETIGIEKEFNIEYGIINVSYGIDIDETDGNSEFELIVYSFDDTELIIIVIEETGWLSYDDGSEHFLYDLNDLSKFFEINLYINANDGICVLILYIDGIYIETFYFPITNLNKHGLGKIEAFIFGGAIGDMSIHLGYLGIYINGTSYLKNHGNEFAFKIIDVFPDSFEFWYYKKHNLLSINGNLNFSTWISLDIYIIGQEIHQLTTQNLIFSNTTETYNIYDQASIYGNYFVGDPFLWFQFWGEFELNSVSIDGVKLVEGLNEYFLEYDYLNVDSDISYFYVVNNRLYFTLTTDDNNLEYIQASFNIILQSTINYTLLYGGIKNYLNMDVVFNLLYLDTTYSPYYIKVILENKNAIIPQGQVIEYFTFIITDNDNDMDYTTTGYFNSFTLVYTIGIEFTILVSDYLAILTPILLITIITITAWQITKKKAGNMLIAPTMAFMTFSTYIMGLIPIWLLFAVIFANGIFLYSKWEDQFSIFSGFATIITGFLSYASIIDFWFFYMTFVIMVGYLVFGNTGNRKFNKG